MKPVEDFHIFDGFCCLHEHDTDRDLEDFIRNDAERHFVDKIAVTYGLFDEEIAVPLGFATLQNDAIVIDKNDQSLPEVSDYPYPSIPAVKLGRFAISLDFQKKRFGTLFLSMIKELLCVANRTGCRFLTVDARRDRKNKVDVTGFYEKNGFTLLKCRNSTSTYKPMYFDLARLPEDICK